MPEGQDRAMEDMAFGDALAELEVIVAQLEGGQLELEESLAHYQRGVGLLKTLQARLAQAQQQVTVLMGELETEPADGQSAPEGLE